MGRLSLTHLLLLVSLTGLFLIPGLNCGPFWDFANFYRDFIDEYAAVTAPLTDLLSEKHPYPSVFNEDQLSAFESLKTALVTAPALAIYSPDSKSFRVRLSTDASRHAVGAVLEQDTGTGWHPVTYYSKKLNDAQSKYSAYDLELLAINEALKRLAFLFAGS
jgi:hypothetical protein